MVRKRIFHYLAQKYASIMACAALAFAVLSANSACCVPYYEPEQPDELECVKKPRLI